MTSDARPDFQGGPFRANYGGGTKSGWWIDSEEDGLLGHPLLRGWPTSAADSDLGSPTQSDDIYDSSLIILFRR